jgi:hypothetical protein
MYTCICIGPLSGVLASIKLSPLINEYSQHIIDIITILLGLLSGLLTTVVKFGRYDEQVQSNKLAVTRYVYLESNIRRQLNLQIDKRICPDRYIEWVELKFNETFINAPLISSNKSYNNTYSSVVIDNESQPQIYTNQMLEYEMNRMLSR